MTSVKFFAGDISHFSIVSDASETFQNLSDDLRIISECSYQWKMHLNLNMSKSSKSHFFKKHKKSVTPTFNYWKQTKLHTKKELGLTLMSKNT